MSFQVLGYVGAVALILAANRLVDLVKGFLLFRRVEALKRGRVADPEVFIAGVVLGCAGCHRTFPTPLSATILDTGAEGGPRVYSTCPHCSAQVRSDILDEEIVKTLTNHGVTSTADIIGEFNPDTADWSK